LETLIIEGIAEGKLIDYKRELPGSNDSAKKEFLFDVSSFANASGGHLIYGIEEKGGIPKEVTGVSVSDADAEIRRLQSLVLTGIEPRVPGVELRFVPMANQKHVLIVQIPKSWALPHMVTLMGTDKFYSRNSAGKHRLDVGELRSLFTLSDNMTNQVRKFRNERLSRIFANEIPFALEPLDPKLILHIVPLQSFSPLTRISLEEASNRFLYPFGATSYSRRFNLDGLLNFFSPSAYLQLYHNGIIETVDSGNFGERGDTRYIPGQLFESKLVQHVEKYLEVLKILGLGPPFVIMLAFFGVRDFSIAYSHGRFSQNIDRNELIIPELLLEKSEFDRSDIEPILDAVWNAAGLVSSPYKPAIQP